MHVYAQMTAFCFLFTHSPCQMHQQHHHHPHQRHANVRRALVFLLIIEVIAALYHQAVGITAWVVDKHALLDVYIEAIHYAAPIATLIFLGEVQRAHRKNRASLDGWGVAVWFIILLAVAPVEIYVFVFHLNTVVAEPHYLDTMLAALAGIFMSTALLQLGCAFLILAYWYTNRDADSSDAPKTAARQSSRTHLGQRALIVSTPE